MSDASGAADPSRSSSSGPDPVNSASPSASSAQPAPSDYDALLLVSFGGPEGPADVMPFLENVAAGKNIPVERLEAVAKHYELFDGVSPINRNNRALLVALIAELNAHGPPLAVYWGNRYWQPLLADAVRQMAEDGIRHALALVTSAFGSPPGCRQYVEAIQRARQEVGPDAPQIDKLRLFYNHPGFIEAMADRVHGAFDEIPPERQAAARLVFTAHSLPVAMAGACPYEGQLREACRLVAQRIGRNDWQLAYQSRSGPPAQAWLEPTIATALREIAAGESRDVVLAPIGFLVTHMEVAYDLDVEARHLCDELGLQMIRAATVGTHPRLIRMIRELVVERTSEGGDVPALGEHGPWPNRCPADCCK
jgi:ferrochelatase